jgi:acyl-homoserine-lactone acylase
MRALLIAFILPHLSVAAPRAEILWDSYGIPHIFAATREQMFYAHGWAQANNQADLLLRLYGESRARSAEYWGPSGIELDRWLQINGVPERAKSWYAAQTPEFRTYLDAFARGINDYAKAHAETISGDARIVLPVSGVDVIGHAIRAVLYTYMGSRDRMQREVAAHLSGDATTRDSAEPAAGSNTWAIGPAHSASGKAMLIINPHLAWGNTSYRYMEVHLTAPGYDLYGAPQIGFPVPVVGFNRNLGWSRTVNTIDTVDFYTLTVKNGQYEFDGKLRAFEHETKTIRVRMPDGKLRDEKLEIRRSVHGPIVYEDRGVTVAMRVAGVDRPKMLEEWFRMGESRNLEEFTRALRMMSIPMWNQSYADRDGHILLVCNGLIPRRKTGDYRYWSRIVPGNTSQTLWTDYLGFDELPKALDPKSGWVQNANEPPWTTTFPQLEPHRFAPFVAPDARTLPQMRVLRSLHMITEDQKLTYEKLLADKFSTRMELADRVLPDLLKAGAGKSEALQVLSKWDRGTDADSRGGVLFQIFFERFFGTAVAIAPKLRVKYDPARPLDTGLGIADTSAALKALDEAATVSRRLFGALDVKWGDVFRFQSGHADVPGNGGAGAMGVFRTITFGRREGSRMYAIHGDTFVCAIEFSALQRAQCSLSYGNASQPGSPHLEDQLRLMTDKKLHPVWRERKDVEAHLQRRDQF